MLKYILKRVVAMAITLFIIISLSFFAIRLIPGDIAGENAAPEIKAAMEARYHLDKPLGEQYAIFIKNFLSFDFGESMTLYPRRPVFTIIKDKIPLTLMLNVFSLCLTVPVGLICGISAALKKNTIIDHTISAMVVFNVSVPAFVAVRIRLSIGMVPIPAQSGCHFLLLQVCVDDPADSGTLLWWYCYHYPLYESGVV